MLTRNTVSTHRRGAERARSGRSVSARMSAPSRAADVPRDRRVERLARSQRGAQPSCSRARDESSRSTGASPAAAPGGAARTASPPGQRRRSSSTSAPTGSSSPASGPKFQLGASPSPASAQPLGEREVALERAEDVLPGPDGLRRADLDRLARLRGPHDVGHEPARRGVPAADHVARAGRDHGEPERAVGGGDVLLPRLGGRVRVVAAERVVLGEAPAGAVVAVALVARDDDDRARLAVVAQRLEHLGRARRVHRERLDGALEAGPDERLGGEVEDDLGARAGDRRAQLAAGADVAADVPGEPVGHVRRLVERRDAVAEAVAPRRRAPAARAPARSP